MLSGSWEAISPRARNARTDGIQPRQHSRQHGGMHVLAVEARRCRNISPHRQDSPAALPRRVRFQIQPPARHGFRADNRRPSESCWEADALQDTAEESRMKPKPSASENHGTFKT